ncbi:hypothetical protein FE391_42600, partial [Nonomuraea sp. KC401]
MKLSILGALLGTVALAGAGGAAISQTSATEPLSTGSPLGARVALTDGPSETPVPSESPTTGEYTAKTKVVKKRGVSYLDVSIAHEGPALFTVKQRVCRRGSCKTTTADVPVVDGAAEATKKLGRGTYKKRGKPRVEVTPIPLPTVTERVTVTVTEPGPTVTFTCRPGDPPTETPPPTDVPTDTPPPTDVP